MLKVLGKPERSLLRCVWTLLALGIALLITGCSQEAQPANVGAANLTLTPTPFVVTVVIATPEPTTTPTPTPTLVPTATPTPDPLQILDVAQRAAWNGDDAQAVERFNAVLNTLPKSNSDIALRARMGLGQSLMGMGDYAGAAETFNLIVSDEPTSTFSADARVLLGRALMVLGNHAPAIVQFQTVITERAVITPYLNLWIGDAYIAAGQPLSAVVPYLQAIEGAPNLSQEFARREKLALALQLSGRYAEALDQYEVILASSRFAAYRARILWESSQVMLTMGQSDAAYARMRDVMLTYPETAAAFSALNALINAGQTVDELQRGIVGYHNGAYAAAQLAFRRAILSDTRTNEVRYWAAQNYVRMGSLTDAYRNLNEVINSGPAADRYGDAVIRKAELQAISGDIDNAAVTYRLLSQTAPANAQAPLALQRVGRAYERAGRLEEAAQAHLAAQYVYPASEGAAESLLRGAVMLYRLGRYAEAVTQTQRLIDAYPSAVEVPSAQLWQSRALLTTGDIITAQVTLSALVQLNPDSYEASRAAEMLQDWQRAPLSKPFWQVLSAKMQIAEQSLNDADDWVRARMRLHSDVDVRSLGQDILADARLARGTELWRMGFKAEGREELDAVRAANSQDALAMYQLALYFNDIGLYRSSISCADAFMRLMNVRSAVELPTVIARLLYPLHYADLIDAHAREYGLDPLLVAALIRQESLFESFAASGASAYGLMQVIPPTGQEINNALQWPPGYSQSDLTRPYVSIRFGTFYLARQRDFLNGDLYAALAAYNGGPGMALRWRDRVSGDPDALYLTMVLDGSGYRETQTYIRTVTANYALYHKLYAGD